MPYGENITWGVDGYGDRHYLCDRCGERFGKVDPYEIKHTCMIIEDEEREGEGDKYGY